MRNGEVPGKISGNFKQSQVIQTSLSSCLQDYTPSGPIQPRRLFPLVCPEELRRQGAVQDHNACGV